MSNFSTVGQINLQPNDEIGWSFKFPIASSTTEKGALPYNRTINSVTVVAYDEDGTDVTSDLIEGSPNLSGDTVYITLKYPATNGDGRYKLTFSLILDNSWVRQFDFQRVLAKTI